MIKEDELYAIAHNIESQYHDPAGKSGPGRKSQTQQRKKQEEEGRPATLQDRIAQQKQRLRGERRGATESQKAPREPARRAAAGQMARYNYHKSTAPGLPGYNTEQPNNDIVTHSSSNSSSTMNKSEKKLEVEEAERGERGKDLHHGRSRETRSGRPTAPAKTSRPPPAVRSQRKEDGKLQPKYAKRYADRKARETQQETRKEEDPRFDEENFTRSATAFNIGLNLSQSQLPQQLLAGNSSRAGEILSDASFTERLINGNSMSKVSKGGVPPRAMSTEDRMAAQCTFRPKLSRCPGLYSHVQPRLLSHLAPMKMPAQPAALTASFCSPSPEPLMNLSMGASGIFSLNRSNRMLTLG